MNQEEYPIVFGGQVWIWKPLDGMDKCVSSPTKWSAAAAYAHAKASGKSDKEAHTTAEKVAYEFTFSSKY